MSAIKKKPAFKKLCEIGVSKPYYGFPNLPHGFHEISCFRMVKSKYAKKDSGTAGKSLLVELIDQILFLPQYFSNNLNESDINEINSTNKKMYLYFGGLREQNK